MRDLSRAHRNVRHLTGIFTKKFLFLVQENQQRTCWFSFSPKKSGTERNHNTGSFCFPIPAGMPVLQPGLLGGCRKCCREPQDQDLRRSCPARELFNISKHSQKIAPGNRGSSTHGRADQQIFRGKKASNPCPGLGIVPRRGAVAAPRTWLLSQRRAVPTSIL